MVTMKLFLNRNSILTTVALNVDESVLNFVWQSHCLREYMYNYVSLWMHINQSYFIHFEFVCYTISYDLQGSGTENRNEKHKNIMRLFFCSSSSTENNVSFIYMINVITLFNINNCSNYVQHAINGKLLVQIRLIAVRKDIMIYNVIVDKQSHKNVCITQKLIRSKHSLA